MKLAGILGGGNAGLLARATPGDHLNYSRYALVCAYGQDLAAAREMPPKTNSWKGFKDL